MTDFEGLLRTLTTAQVDFILVGGVAATAHGSALLTQDLDVVYSRQSTNLDRLAKALSPQSPYLRDAPPDLPFKLDRKTLESGLNFTLTTDLGDLDLLGEITGGGGYDQLLPHTLALEVFGMTVRCLALDWLIRVKRAAGRPKDLVAVAELEALLEEQSKIDQ
ncbi:MAG: hypothetical protein V3S30_05340 [Thermoanaerobaculia bacterium]